MEFCDGPAYRVNDEKEVKYIVFTSSDARDLARTFINYEISRIIESIHSASENGNYSCNVESKLTIKELQPLIDAGYKVNINWLCTWMTYPKHIYYVIWR